MDFTQTLQEALSTVVNFIPPFLAFLAILIIGYFVAKALAKALHKLLARVGFDGAVERSGVGNAMARTDWDASDIIRRIVFYTLMLFVLQMAFGVFGPNPVADLLNSVIAFLPQLLVALVIVVLAGAIAATVRDLITSMLGGLSYGHALANVAGATIVAIGIFAALNQLQIAPAIVNGLFYALLAIIAGSAIIAIGGGGIIPMRRQWERALSRVEDEAPRMREQMSGAGGDQTSRTREQQEAERGSSPGGSEPWEWMTVEQAAESTGLTERRIQQIASAQSEAGHPGVRSDGQRWWLTTDAINSMTEEHRDVAEPR